jgi:hypothetical protein
LLQGGSEGLEACTPGLDKPDPGGAVGGEVAGTTQFYLEGLDAGRGLVPNAGKLRQALGWLLSQKKECDVELMG